MDGPSYHPASASIPGLQKSGAPLLAVSQWFSESMQSIPTSESPLILSAANQLFQEAVYKKLLNYLQVCLFVCFFNLSVDGVRNTEQFTQNA